MKTLCVIFLLAACGCCKQKSTSENVLANPSNSVATASLEGKWQLTMPRGHRADVVITALGNDRFVLGDGGNLSGVYELHSNELVIVDTPDKRMTTLVWQVLGTNKLILIKSPSAPEIGSVYVGAILTRP